jgi:hypothetical protein
MPSGKAIWRIRPARSSSEGTMAPAKSSAASAAPGRPVVMERSCGTDISAAASPSQFKSVTSLHAEDAVPRKNKGPQQIHTILRSKLLVR